MKIFCSTSEAELKNAPAGAQPVLMYHRTVNAAWGSVGAAIPEAIRRAKLRPDARAWDFLSVALAVTAADLSVVRTASPDGWTREIDLSIGVADPEFWNTQREVLERQLRFLTTDIWRVEFRRSSWQFLPHKKIKSPTEESVLLLSGGLDSLVGAIDLWVGGKKLFAVSQTVRGDGEKQIAFARGVGSGLRHIQLNHNTDTPGDNERSQRGRSLIFLAYGVLIATALGTYRQGKEVTLFVCENGFISVNPPLTDGRLGSLSTRTTHPGFLPLVQAVLDAATLKVRLYNPYQFVTKGEMLSECKDRKLLKKHAVTATSCGRFAHFGLRHCGRCAPCMIRRAAFRRAKLSDTTDYVFRDLGKDDSDHAGFDDVRSAAMAIAAVKANGIDAWIGASLAMAPLNDAEKIKGMLERGLAELGRFLKSCGVK